MTQLKKSMFAGWLAMAFLIVNVATQSGVAAEARQKTVLDFEEMSEIEGLRAGSENVDLDMVQDYCVTSGQYCMRVVAKAGKPWGAIVLTDRAKTKDFDAYDYLGLDVFSEQDAEIGLTLELCDKDSVDYYTRATIAEKKVHRGINHLFWKINHARRNGKEGFDWAVLEAKDKIDRANVTRVKLFFTPLKEGGDTRLWMDNMRLLPEDAVGGKTAIALPAGAIGYKFGNKSYCPSGFTNIDARACLGAGTAEIGKEWPDTLTGSGLYYPQGDFSFTTDIPEGEYWVWLSAGKIFNFDLLNLSFQLKVGPVELVNEKYTEKDFCGEKGIFRYLRTQYSERPDAMWLDYALPEAEEFVCKVKVGASPLRVQVNGMRLSAMVLMPAKDEAGFKKVCADIRAARVKYFNERTYVKQQPKPVKPSGAGAYTLWMPKPEEVIRPWSAPPVTDARKKTGTAFAWHGAQGERLTQCLCVTPWEDLGMGDLEISDFQGPSTLPASSIRKYYMNYRFKDASVDEMALLPWTKIRFEPRITWAYWLWMKIPDDAAPGDYTATLTFRPENGGEQKIPVTLTVYPFKLEDTLPVSYGMYYTPWTLPFKDAPAGYASVDDFILALTTAQFKFMREIGFTSTSLPAPVVSGYKLHTEKAQPYWDAAKKAGLGRQADQQIMTSQLGMARRIARDMYLDIDEKKYGSDYVDRNHGVEFKLPAFGSAYLKVMAHYKAWLDKTGMPVAMEVVDEPRENPNPWNRTRDETLRYADWLKEIGFKTFVTLMGDTNCGKDYTPIVDHIDIVSAHAWEGSRKAIDMAHAPDKTLWFYNTGMDRLSWGFYNWAMASKGRWEWHFCAPGHGAVEGHPNACEWYTPFTDLTGPANQAPYFDFSGGMTFKSKFFSVASGITDYAYIYTLEKAIEAASKDKNKDSAVQEAMTFLASVKKAIPEYPGIANMNSADAGALVGAGLNTPVAQMTDAWRAHIAELLTQLKSR